MDRTLPALGRGPGMSRPARSGDGASDGRYALQNLRGGGDVAALQT